MKATSTDQIEVKIEGKVYQGTRIISGTNKLTQIISYGDKSRNDPYPYTPNRRSSMDVTAKGILRDLITGTQHYD